MKITIETENENEREQFGDNKVLHKVCEFALTGIALEAGVLPHHFNLTHGDTFVLFGKLEELQERIRVMHNSNLRSVEA